MGMAQSMTRSRSITRSKATRGLSWRIARRYVSVGRRSQLVGFMSMLTMIGLSLSVAILITVLSVMNGFDQEVRENVLGVLPHAAVSTPEATSEEQWQQIDQALLALPQVTATSPVLQTNGVAAAGDFSRGIQVNGIDPVREQQMSRLSDFMVEGSMSALSESRFNIVLGQSLAQQLGVGMGDRVTLYSLDVSINPVAPLPVQRRFRVAGIYRVGTQELDERMVLIALPDAQALYREPGRFNGLRLRTNDLLAVSQWRPRVAEQLPGGYYLDTWTQWFGAIYDNIRLSRSVVGFLLWLLVAVAAFNLVVSLVMIVRDKHADIAILRTMGASPGLIARIFVWQGCLIGLFGTLLGMIAGVVLSLTVSDLFQWIEWVTGSQLLSAEVYPIDFLPSELRLHDMLMVSGGVIVLCLLASLYPARRAAGVHAAEALRHD